MEILFTHHEILATDPKLYFNQILDFYSIPKNIFSYPKKPKFIVNPLDLLLEAHQLSRDSTVI